MDGYELPFMKKQKTLEQIQENNERLRSEAENEELKLSIEEKRFAFNKMNEAGLKYKKDFNSSLRRLWQWANK